MDRAYTGPELKELRRRALLSQLEVIKQAPVNGTTLCAIERGECKPQARTLERLLRLYAKKIADLDEMYKILDSEIQVRDAPGDAA